MSVLLARPTEDFLSDLKGRVFLNPQTNQWETDDQYLSGNVREKLAVADAAAVNDSAFAVNVEALKSVQPADLNATEIDVRLAASWLTQEDVQRFVHELLTVPNHMLGQFSTELLTLYPGANILVAGKEDFAVANRKHAFRRAGLLSPVAIAACFFVGHEGHRVGHGIQNVTFRI